MKFTKSVDVEIKREMLIRRGLRLGSSSLTRVDLAQRRNIALLCNSLISSGCPRNHGSRQVDGRRHYNPFKRKEMKWENGSESRKVSSECDQIGRKLRELLAATGEEDVDLKVKRLIFQLVKECDKELIKDFVPLIEMGLQKLSPNRKLISIHEIQLIYRSIVEAAMEWKGDDETGVSGPSRGYLLSSSVAQSSSKSAIVTKLYSELYNSRLSLSADDSLKNGLLYIKYLRTEGLLLESRKLVHALFHDLRICSVINEEVVLDLIHTIQNINPDIDSLISLFENIIGDSKLFNSTLFHEGILSFTEIAKGSGDYTGQLMKFLNNTIFIDRKFELTEESLIIVLDCCLTLESVECGKRVLRTLVRPKLDDMLGSDIVSDEEARLQFYELLLMACSKFGEDLAIGQKIVDRILNYPSSQLVKETWDVLAQWTVYQSSDVSSLERVVDEMIDNKFEPDEVTLNEILSIAVGVGKKADKYIDSMVELFNLKYGIDSNVHAFSLLINRKLQSIDIETALQLFQNSIQNGCDWGVENGKYVQNTLDQLLVAMCNTPSITNAQVFQVYQQILMFTKVIGYKPQIELLKMFLSVNNSYDVELFLNQEFGTRPGLPWQPYAEIYHLMFDYILTCKDYKLAWDIYGLLNGLIKLPYESYYPAMQLFCKLGRPDAGLLILKYLRARSRKEGISSPDREMYILLFTEFGNLLYEEGVLELQTLLRTDLYMELDIDIMNSILRAYTNLQDIHKTRDTWLEINGFSQNGVNNDTITIMIKHLTRFSLEEVEKLWVSFPETYGFTPDNDNLKQYVIANCYHGYYMRALEVTKRMKDVYGIEPSQDIIEALYNWTMLDSRKKLVEKWAIEAYPEQWLKLKENNLLKTHVLPDNVDNDSEENLRARTIDVIEGSERAGVVKV